MEGQNQSAAARKVIGEKGKRKHAIEGGRDSTPGRKNQNKKNRRGRAFGMRRI